MFIECKEYNLTELKSALKISKRQWEERKEEILEYLKLFFDYEITIKGRNYRILVKEQYMEYEPLPKKSRVPEIKAFYEKEVDHILTYKKRNTGSNLAREIVACNNKQNHKEGTAANYIRPYLKTNYTVKDKEWCYVDYETFTYHKINKEQLEYLKQQFQKYLSSESVADTIADADAGYISKEDVYVKLKNNYNKAIESFNNKYHFKPYKAGELNKIAWVDEETTAAK